MTRPAFPLTPAQRIELDNHAPYGWLFLFTPRTCTLPQQHELRINSIDDEPIILECTRCGTSAIRIAQPLDQPSA